MRKFLYGFLPVMILFAAGYAFAQDTVVTPIDFLDQVVAFIKSIGGLSTLGIISAVITLLISSMKVTFLDDLIWNKLGSLQIWVAPVLGLIVGLVSQGSSLTLASALAYVASGAGSVYLHELLDKVKLIPGLGPIYVSIISMIEAALGGTPAPAVTVAKK